MASLASLALLKGNGEISFDTQKTVIAAILHAVQDGIQKQIANKIEHLSTEGDSTVASIGLPADDTALYWLSGWALVALDETQVAIAKRNCDRRCHWMEQRIGGVWGSDTRDTATTKRCRFLLIGCRAFDQQQATNSTETGKIADIGVLRISWDSASFE